MAKYKLLGMIILTSVLFFCYCSVGAQSREKCDSAYFKKDFPKQESRSSLIFSGSFMHFSGKQNPLVSSDISGITDYYTFPMNTGLGIYYQYDIGNKNCILSGINFQNCHFASTTYSIKRFRYVEPGISIYLKHYYLRNEKIGLFSMIGLSIGQMKLLASESYGHITWSDFGTKYLENYSNKNSFNDLIFFSGFLFPSSHIEIVPSIGYRITDNWMSLYRHRFFYGFQINYQLNFSKR